MKDVAAPAMPGNAEVIDGLNKALERAKGGMARAAAIVFCEYQGADVMYLGDVNARAQVVYGCLLLNHLCITSSSLNVQQLSNQPPANMVRYDLTSDPICYDFLPWLVTAEMTRQQENAPPPLKVAFVRNPQSLVNITEQKWHFFQNVIRPSLELFGAVEDNAAVNGRHKDFIGLRNISKAFHDGMAVPQITVPPEAKQKVEEFLGGRHPVTLTLREMGAYGHRNSDISEWNKFARWLSRRGESVIVVRDTMRASEPLANFDIYPEASIDLHTRAALYQQAKCNCFVTNGPWGLAYFGSRPWLMFASIDDNQPEDFNRPAWWEQFMGLNADKQIPWALPTQKIIYQRDTFDNMRAAYEGLGI